MAIRCFFERQRCLCFFWFMFARFHRWPRWHPLTLSIKHNWVWPGGITWPILEEAQIEGNFVVISKHNITLRIMISKLDTARAINLNTLSDNVPRPRRAGGTQMSTSTQTLLEGSKPLGHRSHCMLSMCWIKHHLLSHDLLKIDESSRVEQLQQRRSFLGNHDLLRPSQRMMGAWRVLTYLPTRWFWPGWLRVPLHAASLLHRSTHCGWRSGLFASQCSNNLQHSQCCSLRQRTDVKVLTHSKFFTDLANHLRMEGLSDQWNDFHVFSLFSIASICTIRKLKRDIFHAEQITTCAELMLLEFGARSCNKTWMTWMTWQADLFPATWFIWSFLLVLSSASAASAAQIV